MTHNNLGLLPHPNAEGDEFARAVVAAAKKEVVALLSGIRDYYSLLYNYLFSHVQIMKELLCYRIGNWFTHVQVRKSLN